ncbi:hypothetical protein ABLE93_01095 [Xanthobacter sp. KR7-65]|uniref:hypothetical protein n=1 Tax=Xanthobacter sp. KR7-65 TaxID=3156612 RepID=UPI0032B59F2F
MAFEMKGRSYPPPGAQPGHLAAHSLAAADASARERASVLVVAMACAVSGLLVGLCLAAAHWPALAFILGAGLAGTGAWIGRGLALSVSNDTAD